MNFLNYFSKKITFSTHFEIKRINKILIMNCLGSCKDSIHVNTLREDRLMKDFEMIFELAKDFCLGRTRGK